MANYAANNLIRFSTVITQQSDGSLVDPTSVTLRVRDPSGTITDLSGSIIHDSVGQYHADAAFVTGGTYTYEWQGTGAVVVEASRSFTIIGAPF